MIHVHMDGRLGNQFFRYAFARKLQAAPPPPKSISPADRKIILTFKAGQQELSDDWWGNQLQFFKLNPNVEFRYENEPNAVAWYKRNLSLLQQIQVAPYLIIRDKIKSWTIRTKFQKLFVPYFSKRGIYIQSDGYIPEKATKRRNIIVNGYYEAPEYFDDIKEILLDEFTPKQPLLPENQELFNRIHQTESVCVSVRRGDFLAPQHIRHFYVCTSEYYFKALDEIRNRIKNPVFFFFSDDIQWCKETFSDLPEETHFEAGTDPVWEKIRLMSACKHFVIANSTFSWWAQYLSKNQNKVVVSPNRFNNRKDFQSPLIRPEFVTVDV